MLHNPAPNMRSGTGTWIANCLVAWLALSPPGVIGQGAPPNDFNDSHFHLTNYVQQGIEVRDFLKIMGARVGRSTLFGIPLQQQWSYANSGDFAPTY